MKKMQNDDFLKPLKNRPGLKPRMEFKKELASKLQRESIIKHRFQLFKIPTLVGMALLVMFVLFSNDILKYLDGEQSELTPGYTDPEVELNDRISEHEALAIAKKYDQSEVSEKITWKAKFDKNPKELEEWSIEKRPIWILTGEYPLGNKQIFYIDAITGDVLNIKDIETPGFGEGL